MAKKLILSGLINAKFSLVLNVISGLFIGIGIICMHYIGMSAFQNVKITYNS